MLNKIASKYLQKVADYGSFINHEFYDKVNKGKTELDMYKAYYRALDKAFSDIMTNNHSIYGFDNIMYSDKDKGNTENLYIQDMQDRIKLYDEWKTAVDKALANQNLQELEYLTYPTNVYVKTDSPGTAYGDLFSTLNSPSEELVDRLYTGSDRLPKLLSLVNQHKRLLKDYEATSDVLDKEDTPFQLEYDILEDEKSRVLAALNEKVEQAWNNWYEADKNGKNADLVKNLWKVYETLDDEYSNKSKPFYDKEHEIDERRDKALKKYQDKLNSIYDELYTLRKTII
jgi:hypothetical protein